MNSKGFTLVELIATIVVLAIVMSIGAYSIVNVIKNSRNENYKTLINNVKSGAETYYQECKYSNNSGITCNNNLEVTLGELVTYGYLTGNGSDNSKYTLVNPLDEKDISNCKIRVTYDEGTGVIKVVNISDLSNSNFASCPKTY